MAIKRLTTTGAQYVKLATFYFNFDDTLTANGVETPIIGGGALPVIDLPEGARILGGSIEAVAPLAGVTTPAFDIKYGATPLLTGNAGTSASFGITAPVSGDGPITLNARAASGTATAGQFAIRVEFVELGTEDVVIGAWK